MAEVNFSKDKSAPAIPVEAVVTPVATPAAPAQAVVRTNTGGIPLGDDLPGFDEVLFPRLNLVHNMGALKDTFTPGEIVFDKRTILFSPPVIDKQSKAVITPASPPANITVIGIIWKKFSEKVEGGTGGQVCNTEAEVRAAGGTLDYNEWKMKKADGMKRFENTNDMLIAIRRPDHIKDDDTIFTFEIGAGKKYAIGKWQVKGSAYTAAFKSVLAHARLAGILRAGYPTFSYSLTTVLRTVTGFPPFWVPVLIPAEKSTPEFLEFVKQIVNPATAPAA